MCVCVFLAICSERLTRRLAQYERLAVTAMGVLHSLERCFNRFAGRMSGIHEIASCAIYSLIIYHSFIRVFVSEFNIFRALAQV